MVTPQEVILEKVLAEYPIKAGDIRNETIKEKKGVWWVGTDRGLMILKRMSSSEETLRYILNAVGHLAANGILIPAVVKTRDGAEYVCIDGVCYILMKAIEGSAPEYGSAKELSGIVRGLASFHKASRGFFPSEGTKPKYHLGTWVDDYIGQLEDIRGFVQDKDFSAAEPQIAKDFPYFAQRAGEAIEGLKGSEYAEWIRKAGAEGCLCHQDFAAGNLILTPKGELYVLDIDSLTVDIPARDIRKLLNKIMKKNGKWEAEKTRRILEDYQEVNPLTRDEWKVVMLDLAFPHLYLGAVNKYCYRRDREWSDEKYHKRIAEMSAFEKTVEPVLKCFDSIVPVKR
jgi:spore coat-associated protein S